MVKAALLYSCLLAGMATPAEGDAGLAEKWRSEYPDAASELEEIASNFLAKGSFRTHYLKGNVVVTNELTVASSGDKRLFICDGKSVEAPAPKKGPEPSLAYCVTPGYVFKLRRPSKRDRWVVNVYEKQLEDKFDFDYDFDMYARSSTVFGSVSLMDRVKSSSFAASAVSAVTEAGKEFVKIDYSLDEPEYSESGFVFLNPGLGWAIHRFDYTDRPKRLGRDKKPMEPSRHTGGVKYRKVSAGVSVPVWAEHTVRIQGDDRFQSDQLELREVTLGKVPDEVFKLTSFGLPDLPLKAVREPSAAFSLRNPLFWGSLAAAVVSFGLLRRTRSKAATGPAAPRG